MVTVLINLLNNKKELHGWKINYTHTIGNEAYFIKTVWICVVVKMLKNMK